eukprot:TRINITY_DN3853_c0_g1_i1.p1 TRINITY_DN3853_c0_g1~~TRINITY_DN3853_c0_g1_i1.p1  ORF type:complete len:393 (+),score=134.85 TRINITY_DN3853_c0_g1_i1:150-1328(+)
MCIRDRTLPEFQQRYSALIPKKSAGRVLGALVARAEHLGRLGAQAKEQAASKAAEAASAERWEAQIAAMQEKHREQLERATAKQQTALKAAAAAQAKADRLEGRALEMEERCSALEGAAQASKHKLAQSQRKLRQADRRAAVAQDAELEGELAAVQAKLHAAQKQHRADVARMREQHDQELQSQLTAARALADKRALPAVPQSPKVEESKPWFRVEAAPDEPDNSDQVHLTCSSPSRIMRDLDSTMDTLHNNLGYKSPGQQEPQMSAHELRAVQRQALQKLARVESLLHEQGDEQRAGEYMDKYDWDGDGKLDQQEFGRMLSDTLPQTRFLRPEQEQNAMELPKLERSRRREASYRDPDKYNTNRRELSGTRERMVKQLSGWTHSLNNKFVQ